MGGILRVLYKTALPQVRLLLLLLLAFRVFSPFCFVYCHTRAHEEEQHQSLREGIAVLYSTRSIPPIMGGIWLAIQ